jgi:hypothetical protein
MTCKNEINYKDPISPVFQSQLLISEIFLGAVFCLVSLLFAFSGSEKMENKGKQSNGVAE